MIKRIRIEGFKSFKKVELELGRLNLLIGTNASGKTNFLEALRVIQGLHLGYTVNEVLNGTPRRGQMAEWRGIRGGSDKCGTLGPDGGWNGTQPKDFTIELDVEFPFENWPIARCFTVVQSTGQILHQRITASFHGASEEVVVEFTELCERIDWIQSPEGNGSPISKKGRERVKDPNSGPGLLTMLAFRLQNMQFLDLQVAKLREYAATNAKRMGDLGENFAGVVQSIMGQREEAEGYVSWLKSLTPKELDDVSILKGALDEPLFAVREGGVDFPAHILSDGTLRFAAIAAAFFQPDRPSILALEEIENCIHPTRLRLLLELLTSQAERTDAQVFATTHSPLVIEWAKAFGGARVFHFQRDEETGESQVRSLDLSAQNHTALGELMSEGWLEVMK